MAKVVIVKSAMRRRRKYSAANGSERRDGQQAVMAKRVAQATRAQHQSRMINRTKERANSIPRARRLGVEPMVCRHETAEEQRSKRMRRNTTTGLISSQTANRKGKGTPSEDDEQEDPVQGLRDDVARGPDDGWSQGSRTVPVETALVCSTPE